MIRIWKGLLEERYRNLHDRIFSKENLGIGYSNLFGGET